MFPEVMGGQCFSHPDLSALIYSFLPHTSVVHVPHAGPCAGQSGE